MIFELAGTRIEVDLLRIEPELNKVEASTGFDGSTPTPSLLDAFVKWLATRGARDCTRSMAWQVWWAIYERIDLIKRHYQVEAELGFWYSVDPFTLTEPEKIGLLANMNRVKAQSRLHHGQVNPTDYEGVYNLTLLATGDETKARQARANALERYVDAQIARRGK